MTESLLLRDLGWILVAAAVLALLTRPLRVPGVVAYILAGVVLGPVTGLIEVTAELEVLAELGVALLLFLVGLDLRVERIREVGGVAVAAGAAQVVVTFGAGLGLALALGFELPASLVVALAVTFSSTAVVVKLLGQKRELGARHGQIAVGILLVQDVAVVLALTLVGGLAPTEGGAAGAGILGQLLPPLAALAALSVAALLAARWVLPPLFRAVSRVPEIVLVWSLAWLTLFILVAELTHLPLEIGAFLAGIALAQLPEAEELGRRVGPLTNFFLAVFFVALGIQIEPAAAASRPGAVAALVVFVLAGKTTILFWILARRGEDEPTGFRAALSLAQISEFSFVLAALATGAGLLDPATLSVIGAAGLVTIAVSSYLILEDESLYRAARNRGLLRPFRASAPEPGPTPVTELPAEGHVIVVGMNALGRILVRRIAGLGRDVVAVDRDPGKLAGLPARTVHGDVEHPDVLEDANLTGAALLISALQIEDANKLLAYRSRRAGVPASIHVFNPSVAGELYEMGVEHLMAPKDEGARRIGERLRSLGVLGTS